MKENFEFYINNKKLEDIDTQKKMNEYLKKNNDFMVDFQKSKIESIIIHLDGSITYIVKLKTL